MKNIKSLVLTYLITKYSKVCNKHHYKVDFLDKTFQAFLLKCLLKRLVVRKSTTALAASKITMKNFLKVESFSRERKIKILVDIRHR